MRAAFVVQRYGKEVNGGAELLCRQIAERLAARMDVDVISTCAIDYVSWKNEYPPGVTEDNRVLVHRFPVSKERDIERFNQLSNAIYPRRTSASMEECERWMIEQGPYVPEIWKYLYTVRDRVNALFFFTYLYATSYFGLPGVREKAILVPLAHDEWPIYMPIWDSFFELPKGFIFSTPEEKNFLRQRFPHAYLEGPIIGVGIESPMDVNADRFRQQYDISSPFLLYIGRIDPSKGCDQFFANFLALKQSGYSGKLILLGRAVMAVPEHPDIVVLGFVEDHVKWDAIAACDCLVMPSPYESLSMVLLEAWVLGKPTLVNSRCDVLVGQSRRSQGGLWFESEDEFIAAIKSIDTFTRNQLGIQGRAFVKANYTWDRIISQYIDILEMMN